jgi:hypothetical protein
VGIRHPALDFIEHTLPTGALADFARGTELGSEDHGAWHNLGVLLRSERPAEALAPVAGRKITGAWGSLPGRCSPEAAAPANDVLEIR